MRSWRNGRRARLRANSHLELTGLSSRLKRLFDITGLGEIMDIQAVSKEVKIDETV